MQRITYDAGDGNIVAFIPESEADHGGGGGGEVTTPPVAPTEVAVALSDDNSSVDVSWFDASDNESSFFVELVSADNSAALAQTATLPAGSARTTFSGLDVPQSYMVRVTAMNDAGKSTSQNVSFSTVKPVDNGGGTVDDPLTSTPGGPVVSTIKEATAGKYIAPGVGMVAAEVKSADDTVVKVTFYIDGKEDRSQRGDAPPFLFTFNSLPVGIHTLHVVATDSKGRRGVAMRTIEVVTSATGVVFLAVPGTLQGFLDKAQPGDAIIVRGSHTGQYRVTKGGFEGRPVQIRFEAGASIDARGKPFALTPADPTKPSSTSWVALFDPNIVGASNANGGHNAAMILGNDWTCVGGVISGTDATGVGMNGVRCSAFGLRAQGNGQNGISSSKGQYVAVVGCTSDGNNTKKNNPASEGGGGKYSRTNYTINDACTFKNNIGPGLWHDINNANYVVARSVFDHNVKRDAGKEWQGAGYRTEISTGPGCVCDNVMRNNDGSGMSVDEARDFTAYGNAVSGGGGGVEFRNLKRSDNDNVISNVRIVDNVFTSLKVGVATSSATAKGWEWSTSRPKDWKMTIDGNTYKGVAAPIVWAGKTYRGKTDFGLEANGKFL